MMMVRQWFHGQRSFGKPEICDHLIASGKNVVATRMMLARQGWLCQNPCWSTEFGFDQLFGFVS